MTETDVAMPSEAPAQREKKPANQNKNNNRKPRNDLPIDPDAPVVKPAEVAAPDETQHNAAMQKLKDNVDAGEEKIKAVDAEIEKLKGVRTKQEAATKGLSVEIREFRDKMRALQSERDGMQEQLNLLTDRKKAHQERLKNLRKQFKTTDLAAIDAEIKTIETRLSVETHDLKTEKEYVHRIKKLTADKDAVREYNTDHAAVKAKEEEHEAKFQALKSIKNKVNDMRTIEREMYQKLDAAKAGAVEGEEAGAEVGNANAKILELMSKKADIINENKAHRSAQRELSVALKIKFAEYREYQRALAAYKDKLDKVDYVKRRAEQQARYETMKEERKSKDKERSENKKRMEARYVAVANGCQVYVGGLAIKAAEEDLRAIFEPFGTLTDVMVVRDNDTELSRGFSFVTYENEEAAKAAIKQYNKKENAKLCPPHGRLSIKIAEKSRQQKDWEKANRNKIIGKEPKETKEPKATRQDSEAGEEQEVTKEEANEEEAEVKESDAKKEEGGKKKKVEKKQWEAKREDWQKDVSSEEVTIEASETVTAPEA